MIQEEGEVQVIEFTLFSYFEKLFLGLIVCRLLSNILKHTISFLQL